MEEKMTGRTVKLCIVLRPRGHHRIEITRHQSRSTLFGIFEPTHNFTEMSGTVTDGNEAIVLTSDNSNMWQF